MRDVYGMSADIDDWRVDDLLIEPGKAHMPNSTSGRTSMSAAEGEFERISASSELEMRVSPSSSDTPQNGVVASLIR